MALVLEKGQPALVADWPLTSTSTAPSFSVDLIDAATEKVSLIGNVWHPTIKTGTINIRKVHFRTGTVTLNAASEVRVSLQDVSQTAGPVMQPDGVQDQFFDFKTATTTLASAAWNATGNLSADRAVNLASLSAADANSRRLAVVIEYQVFTAADAVNIASQNTAQHLAGLLGTALFTGSWTTSSNRTPIVAFECSDGSFAFMNGGLPISQSGSVSVSSTAAIRRAAVRFRVPTARTLERVALAMQIPNGCDGRLVLYDSDGTTELRAINIDNDDIRSAVGAGYFDLPVDSLTLAANTFYRLAFVGSTATSATVSYIETDTAALMDGLALGQDAHWSQHDGTNWTELTTRRPTFGLGFGSFDDGAGAGALLVHPSMTGGMRG